jgi:2-polyprenyl-6-methoxyphenol hydroxylase-like FAD-dependent oxidoreductase
MKPVPTPVKTLVQSRPFLEQHVRHFVAARANVCFIDGCEVNRLYANEDHTRIMGVSLVHHSPERHEEDLAADLVVDASGRGSRTPQWLASLGYGSVEESSVKIDVGYATRIYRRPDQLSADWKLLIVYGTPPGDKRAGLVLPMEGGHWMVTLAGGQRDYPPAAEAGFLDYARSLAVPHLYEAIKDAEPVTPIVTYKYSANRWRHYERMSRLPEGFIVMGDAVCSFNPVYGQGMSVAALEAKLLDTCLRDQQRHGTHNGMADFPRRFQQALTRVVKTPWMLTTGEDFRHPETEGKRPFGMNLFNWYTRRVIELTASNPLVTVRFFQVRHLLKPLATLFHPRIVWAVLSKELASRRQKPVASPATDQASSLAPAHMMDAVAK